MWQNHVQIKITNQIDDMILMQFQLGHFSYLNCAKLEAPYCNVMVYMFTMTKII
jgi:hypothetical protein